MIIVVGTGRCGTSMVAKTLHDSGVHMGDRFWEDPVGHGYEDSEFVWMNRGCSIGRIPIHVWQAGVLAIAEHRREPWGFKDPKSSELTQYLRQTFPLARYVRCHRDREETVASKMRAWGWDKETAERVYDQRTRIMDRWLPPDRTWDVRDFNTDGLVEWAHGKR